ncbi:MAG: DUF881 domain-containing protein [Peptostreptococcales bacterium]
MKIRKLLLFLLCVLIGLLITIQSRVITGSFLYVSPKTLQDYKISIDNQEKENDSIRTSIQDKEEQLKKYMESPEKSEEIVKSAEKELAELKMISGVTDVYGDGIIIVLDDGTRELYPGEDPLDIIVHDVDILKIINELRIAGAEAISINGQRVINTTEINCSGHSIRINNQFFAQPFFIKAIGNPNMMEAAIMSPGGYGELLLTYGLIVNVDKVIHLKINKHEESIEFKYVKAAAREGELR